MENKIKLMPGWFEQLSEEFSKPYMDSIKNFLVDGYKSGKNFYPKKSQIFNAFNLCDFYKVKVIILGQDPYHGPGQAHGLSFSVPENTSLPPSLMNIYKELEQDLNEKVNYKNGNLEYWANQGVFLLNSTLTVEKNKPLSHSKIGWDIFTNVVIEKLSLNLKNLVFILWGKYAQSKITYIDNSKHLVIKSVHPSPLSAHRGFFGSNPFSKTNKFLNAKKIKTIDWIMKQ